MRLGERHPCWRRALGMLVLGGAVGGPLHGQAASGSDGLASLLLRFFSSTRPVVLRPNPAFDHSAHFISQPAAQATLAGINAALAGQLAVSPLASSSAAFAYTFNPALGLFGRSTESFGPAFAERGLTAGKGRFSVSVNHLRARYDTLDGTRLRDGEVTFFLRHVDFNSDGSSLREYFEGDVIRANLFLSLESRSTVVAANYGLGERLDVGVALPFQQVSLEARIHTTIERLATGNDPFVFHAFDERGGSEADFFERGSAAGLGDVLLRAKYRALRVAGADLALLAELRLPTGDERELLGSGRTQTRLGVALSGGGRRFSPHLNLAYAFTGGGAGLELPDELGLAAGFDAALHRRLTLSADVVGRRLQDATRAVQQPLTLRFTQRTDPTVREVTRSETATRRGTAQVGFAALGLRFNPVGRLLVSGHVLLGLGDAGLQDRVVPSLGVDYSF